MLMKEKCILWTNIQEIYLLCLLTLGTMFVWYDETIWQIVCKSHGLQNSPLAISMSANPLSIDCLPRVHQSYEELVAKAKIVGRAFHLDRIIFDCAAKCTSKMEATILYELMEKLK